MRSGVLFSLYCLAGLCLLAEEKLTVFVSVPPQVEAAQRIGGPEVQVEILVPPGMNPENYQLTMRTDAALRAAKAVFLLGMPLEKGLRERIAARQPEVLLLDTRVGMTIRAIEGHCADEQHGTDGMDPHVWLDVDNMIVHARHLERVFAQLRPAAAKLYRQRADSYTQELTALQQELQATMQPFSGRQVLVVHPAFGYFLAKYGLRQLAVEQDGKQPGARYLNELLRHCQEMRAKAIFTQPQFSDRSARSLARRLDLEVILMDPLPLSYSQGLRKIASLLTQALAD